MTSPRGQDDIDTDANTETAAFLQAGQQALAARDAGAPVAVSLPAGGELYLDHPLPYLVVYREPPSQPDRGTSRLASSEAAYLLAPGHARHLGSLQQALRQLRDDALETYGAFLLLELWAGVPRGTEPHSPEQGPAFRVHARPGPELTATVEALVRALRLVRIRQQPAVVEVVRTEGWAPPRMRPLVPPKEARQSGIRLVGLEVAPIYRGEDGELYPMRLARLRRQLSVALRRAAHRFAVTRTAHPPVSYEAYGTSALQPSVHRVDTRLAEISQSYDFLVNVTPVNMEEAWAQFRRDRLEQTPTFHYRPLLVDPVLAKRRLFEAPIERIEDPTLADLFREKQLSLDRELTMLLDRGTDRFLHGSMQLYGGVDPSLVELARELVARIPPADLPASDDPLVDAEAFAARAREEIEYYRRQAEGVTVRSSRRTENAGHGDMAPSPAATRSAMIGGEPRKTALFRGEGGWDSPPERVSAGFDARVEVREELYTDILTSHGTLLVGGRVQVPRSAVEPYIHHEIGTHALTYHNGRAQPFALLVIGLPGYDELQEGMAVLSEYLGGGLSPSRLRWLAGRVLAVQMLLEGAEFVETFRALHRAHGFKQEQAFAVTARVYRGGGLTKDAVYLRGLAHVLTHLQGNYNMDVLLVGKMAARHIPIVEELHLRRVLEPAPFRPRYLLEYEGQQRLRRVRQGLTVLDLLDESP